MKTLMIFLCCLIGSTAIAQNPNQNPSQNLSEPTSKLKKAPSETSPKLKRDLSEREICYLRQEATFMARTDQLYRSQLTHETTDTVILARIDSVFNTHGVEAGITYQKSLHLSLSKAVEDSLWELQHALDLANHLCLRGIIETYGWLPKEVLGEHHYIQHLLLLHPPTDWDVPTFLKNYSDLLRPEVVLGRMPAKDFASFYDNMKSKILGEPQLYGTNQMYDSKSQKVLPPIIQDLEASNAARAEIGLPALQTGEYRIVQPD